MLKHCTFTGSDEYESRTQILDPETMSWREGGPLPDLTADPGFASNGQTTFLVGGRDTGSYYDWILEWDPEAEVWIQREETLSLERAFLGAVFVEDDKVQCLL